MVRTDFKEPLLDHRFDDAPKTNAVFHLMDQHVELGHGFVPCLIESEPVSQSMSFGDFQAAVNNYSRIFRDNGIHKDDKVLVLLKTGKLFHQTLLAIIRLGAIAVVCDHETACVTQIAEKEQIKIIVTDYTLRRLIEVNRLTTLQQVMFTEHMNQLTQTNHALDVVWVKASQPMVIIYDGEDHLCYCHGHIECFVKLSDDYLIQTEETVLVPALTYTHPLFYWLAWIQRAGVYIGLIHAKTVEHLVGFVALIDEDTFGCLVKADCELEALAFDQQKLVGLLRQCARS